MKNIAQILSLDSTGHNYSGGTQKKRPIPAFAYFPFPPVSFPPSF